MSNIQKATGTNWHNQREVIEHAMAWARRDGIELIVIKYPDRPNFNITFASRLAEVKKQGGQVIAYAHPRP